MRKLNKKSGFSEILLYTTPNGKVKVEIYLQNETIWLTQQKIADLFGVDRTVITKHLKNIFDSHELNLDSVVQKLHILPVMENHTPHSFIILMQ
jgi:hypothetical protein